MTIGALKITTLCEKNRNYFPRIFD